jgi:hypothetical protein
MFQVRILEKRKYNMLKTIFIVFFAFPTVSGISNAGSVKIIYKDDRFIAYNNGVVKDTNTGLEWMAGPDRNTTWYAAKRWVEGLSADGPDWRMPTIKELKTFYEKGAWTRSMTPLLKTSGCFVWSGDAKEPWPSWGVYFDRSLGIERWGHRDDAFSLRGVAVRFRK